MLFIEGGKIRMTYQGNLLSKTLVIGILILFVGMSVVPSISGNISESNIISNECRRINKMIFNGDRDQLDQNQSEWSEGVGHEYLPKAQSFIPTLNVLTRVKLITHKEQLATGNITVSIRSDLERDDLTFISIPSESFPSFYEWIEFDFPDIYVIPQQTYFIVWTPKQELGSVILWGYHGSDDPYPKGEMWHYSQYWETFWPGSDFSFQTYGYMNNPPNTPRIIGPTRFKEGEGGEYQYKFYSNDSDGDDICYLINWSDGTQVWTDFYASGEEITINVTIPLEKGTYKIFKIRAKDIFGEESDWAVLEITVPRNRAPIYSLFQLFLDRFPLLEVFLRAMNLLR